MSLKNEGLMMAWEMPKHVTKDTGVSYCVFQNKELGLTGNRVPSENNTVVCHKVTEWYTNIIK